jgi:hypothetical protein
MDEAFGQAERRDGEPNAAGRRELFHARRQVRGLADGGIIDSEIAADRAHHDVSGVETDADLHLEPLGATQLVRVTAHGFLHPERGIACAHGVILVREGSTEQGHDAIAHHLIDGALVVVDGTHHALENGIEDLARSFGVAAAQ